MKKFFLSVNILFLFCSGVIFALTDTDADGVSDEKDICPRVYSRSETGCPALTKPVTWSPTNSCIGEQIKKWKIIAVVTPLCNKENKVCSTVSKVTGFQSCDPIFPVILDKNGGPLIRGAVYIVDFTK